MATPSTTAVTLLVIERRSWVVIGEIRTALGPAAVLINNAANDLGQRRRALTNRSRPLQKDIAATLLPDISILLASTDGETRAWVAERHKKLREMLGAI